MKIRTMTEEGRKSKIIRIVLKIKLKIMKEKRHYLCKRQKKKQSWKKEKWKEYKRVKGRHKKKSIKMNSPKWCAKTRMNERKQLELTKERKMNRMKEKDKDESRLEKKQKLVETIKTNYDVIISAKIKMEVEEKIIKICKHDLEEKWNKMIKQWKYLSSPTNVFRPIITVISDKKKDRNQLRKCLQEAFFLRPVPFPHSPNTSRQIRNVIEISFACYCGGRKIISLIYQQLVSNWKENKKE